MGEVKILRFFFDMLVVQGQEGLWNVVPVFAAMNFCVVLFAAFLGFFFLGIDLSGVLLCWLSVMERVWSWSLSCAISAWFSINACSN